MHQSQPNYLQLNTKMNKLDKVLAGKHRVGGSTYFCDQINFTFQFYKNKEARCNYLTLFVMNTGSMSRSVIIYRSFIHHKLPE